LVNLRRSYRPQWAMELLEASRNEQSEQAIQAVGAKSTFTSCRRPSFRSLADISTSHSQVNSTLALLESTRSLVTNLSDLSYHHHLHHLPRTSNASRLYSHSPKPIEWDPQDPGKAMKSYMRRRKDRDEKGEGILAELADRGLRGLRNRAEKDVGVALGRWESKG